MIDRIKKRISNYKVKNWLIIYGLIILIISVLLFDKDIYMANLIESNTAKPKTFVINENYDKYKEKFKINNVYSCQEMMFNLNTSSMSSDDIIIKYNNITNEEELENWKKEYKKTYELLMKIENFDQKFKKQFNECVKINNQEERVIKVINDELIKSIKNNIELYNNGKTLICKDYKNQNHRVHNRLGFKIENNEYFYKSKMLLDIKYCE